jgi:hypothetical protein
VQAIQTAMINAPPSLHLAASGTALALALVLPGFLGGASAIVYEQAHNRRDNRGLRRVVIPNPYGADMAGRSLRAPRPGTALKRTGAALVAAGIIFNIAIQAVPYTPFQSVPFDVFAWGRTALQYFALLVIIPGGAFLLWRGRQYAARASAELILADSQSHVLYLRAFRSDALIWKQAFRTLDSSFLLGLESEEEQLAEVLLPFGALIAIGRPGENLPTPGAARLYTSDEEWKDVVKRRIQTARLVVIRAAAGENVFWELTQAVEILNPQKLLILLNMKVRDYESFRARADGILAVPLPPSARLVRRRRVAGFIGFAEGWELRFFALRAPLFRGGSFKRLCKYALKPVFENSGMDWRAPPMSEKIVTVLFLLFILLGPILLLSVTLHFWG